MPAFSFRGLRAKIFFATAFVIVLVLGGALLFTKQRADRAADASIAKALEATQSAIHDALASRSRTLKQVTQGLARVPTYVSRISEAIRADNRANLLDQADEFRSQIGATWALITDNSGILKAWTLKRNEAGSDFSQGALVGLALEGNATEGLWVEPGSEGDQLFQAVGVPILAPGGNTLYGILVAALPIDSTLAAELKRHTNSDVVFFARDTTGQPHVALATLPAAGFDAAIASLPFDSGFAAGASQRLKAEIGGETWVGLSGPLLTASGYPLGGYAGFRPRSQELAAYTALQRTVVLVFGLGLVLALLSSLLIAGQITRPVQRLVSATREVSEGRYTASFVVETRDEIGELAGAFARMVHDLKEKQELVEFLSGGAGQTLATAPTSEVTRVVSPARASLAAGLRPGSLLANRYEVKEILGAGGMGVVYRAYDRQLQEVVAIKTLKPDVIAADASSLERFKQEIRLARRITHRNVLRTHDLGEVDGIYFITMEYAEGTSLADLIQKRGRLPVGVTLTIGKQLCRALEVAHEEGVVHRDIKPQNLMIDPSGFLKVMDFGIARLAEKRRQGGPGLTEAGAVIGTPEYMSPEQLLGEELDGRSDLYAAGAVLFECVTGRRVFSGPNVTAVIAAQLTDPPDDPRTLNPDVPGPLATIILKALAKKRDARWKTAREMDEALEKV
ncbi:MAG TPA: protein kinase [Gemmatimonadales bacterium]|nr:protein kinase [Gemmatimonadales bacterium]